ncbi:PrsW family glutamic-type intramembrane protease [Paenibacillus aurantius]|uniref:PrsW family glutamic-type intramembrane protease n=1 Tax=Paenibacillus aurantius TaxID=2918900 RepID=A0AA96LHG3_9BACL|nr:PrsW family glutamic-type intramembrane protease [Paenibacillus aurantius]WNQ13380.1 PrsW family glutamic-type intramembrane protease [Paenibacillus aurantius]
METKERERHSAFYRMTHRDEEGVSHRETEELKRTNLFSEVFRRHTQEEAEKVFIVGTALTTPSLEEVAATWPKPWLFARVFLVAALSYLMLIAGLLLFGNLNFLPGLIVMGAFIVPFTILVFFWEMNAPQNIAIYKVVNVVFLGGILSLILALFLYQGFGDQDSVLVTGIAEEVAKVLAVVWFLRNRKYRYMLNGLLIGAAVGTGFAAFETAGYALRVALTSDLVSMLSTIFWRGVLAPGGHIVWAALAGAVLCQVKGSRPFEWTMLRDTRFVRMFVVVVLLHAAWDLPIANGFALPYVQIGLTVLSWAIALKIIRKGLKELADLRTEDVHEESGAAKAADREETVRPVL